MSFIGIAGGTGSGKSTLSSKLILELGEHNVTVISQDWYYHDHSYLSQEEREEINFDHPKAIDYQLMYTHLIQLKKGVQVQLPQYDFSTHTRKNEVAIIFPKKIIIVEGTLLLFDERVRDILDLRIFLDIEPDLRILRRIIRDTTERGRTIQSIYKQYLKTVKPMHDIYVEPTKAYADFIFPNEEESKIIKQITYWIYTQDKLMALNKII